MTDTSLFSETKADAPQEGIWQDSAKAAVEIEPPELTPISAPCENCGAEFAPRQGSGGKRQKYCSEPCRRAADNGRQSQRGQRGVQRGDEAAPDGRPHQIGTIVENSEGRQFFVPQSDIDKIDQISREMRAEEIAQWRGDDDQFDWSDSKSVLLHRQPETAIYRNEYGHVVIRQAAWPEDDTFVTISPENLQVVIDRLCDMAGIPAVGGPA